MNQQNSPIHYTTDRLFTKEQVQELFLSVGWVSGTYPEQLYQALLHSSYLLTAWDGDQLVGLVRGLDDGCMTAFLHYLLVRADHQHQGIAVRLIEEAKAHYRDFFYLNLMPDESRNAPFYQRHGFQILPDGVAMQWCNPRFSQNE